MTSTVRASSAALRTALRNKRLIGFDGRLLSVVTAFSLIAGLTQAALLLVIARAAAGLTDDPNFISGPIGPFGGLDLSTGELLWLGAALVVVLIAFEITISWTQATLQARAQQRVRSHLQDAFAAASHDAQSALPRGDQQHILNSLTSEASTVTASLGNGLVALASFVTLTVSAFLLSPLAAVTVIGGLGVMLGILRPVLRLGRTSGDEHMQAARRLSARVVERLETTLEVKSFGVDETATATVKTEIDQVAHRTRRLRFVNRMSSVIYRVGAMALVLGMLAVITGVGATDFAALTGALLMLLRSLSYGQAAQAAYQQINEVLPVVRQLEDEEQRLLGSSLEPIDPITPRSFGPITLDGVGFTYPTGDDAVLTDVNVTIEPGEFVAIVGPSGSGKSTLMALLLRLRRPSVGAIRMGDHDLHAIDSTWWHEHVAYVPQVSKLQSGTVADAIRFGRDLSDEDVRRAARLAHIAEEIELWPHGYDTEVGQLGDQLSGGQRQRVALARALAGRPAMLLLDEPTSALDPTSERLIADSLEELRGETTIVTIAHRRSTVETASMVVHVRDGRIVDGEVDTAAALEAALSV